jgi:hypothetical protein
MADNVTVLRLRHLLLLLLLLLLCALQVVDADILAVINKLAKQRKDSIEQYTAGVWGGSNIDTHCAQLVLCVCVLAYRVCVCMCMRMRMHTCLCVCMCMCMCISCGAGAALGIHVVQGGQW